MNATATEVEMVVKLYGSALEWAIGEVTAAKAVLLRAPVITREGLTGVHAVTQSRVDLRVALNNMVSRAMTFPKASRGRRLLAGLAKYLANAPYELRTAEGWLSLRTMRDVSDVAGGLVTPAEAAGVVVLTVMMVSGKDEIAAVVRNAIGG